MDALLSTNDRPLGSSHLSPAGHEAHRSAVSWAAVIAGAFVAAALSLVLLALGTGLGLSAISPWAKTGASAAVLGVSAIVWLVLMHLLASAMGGYLAGRLRTKWVDVHTDEVFFRDTAHGFLVWAVGLVLTASFLASAASSLIGGVAQTGATSVAVAAGTAAAGVASDHDEIISGYLVDGLLRSNQPEVKAQSVRAEVARILVNGLRQDTFPVADKRYLSQLVAAQSGLSPPDAGQRVSEVLAQAQRLKVEAQQAADTARKAAARVSLWTFLALMIGAFCACYAATIGGRQRDAMPTHI